ncbi:hypothetical protein SAMN04489761_3078 [Tenacibaculum sp. MAR_2009_124]|uniref:hypothetical protein n=1 Tax=Tenacibaculum sp. MAR_2009_124 TaxID=1250059 RepID=UPI000897C43F|nr:hypothetical protein [Tenacibaculum sp. MAR_2009_124]SEC46879.1 hypothetical protein SAMN04489761_3078 [Tenacibaculum sp. MAR_2009_124]
MKIELQIPNTWNELSDSQLKQVARLYFSQSNPILFDIAMFKILVKCKWYKLRLRRQVLKLLNIVSLSELKTHYRDFYKSQNLTRFIKQVHIQRKSFVSPSDRLGNITIGEFSVLEDLYLGYLNNKDNEKEDYGYEYLLYMFAVLYVPKAIERPTFKKELLSQKAEQFRKVKKEEILSCLLSYMGCRDYIASIPKYAAIFPKGENKSKKIPTSSGIAELIIDVSGSTFGDYHKTFKTNLYTFLDDYAKKLKESKNG